MWCTILLLICRNSQILVHGVILWSLSASWRHGQPADSITPPQKYRSNQVETGATQVDKSKHDCHLGNNEYWWLCLQSVPSAIQDLVSFNFCPLSTADRCTRWVFKRILPCHHFRFYKLQAGCLQYCCLQPSWSMFSLSSYGLSKTQRTHPPHWLSNVLIFLSIRCPCSFHSRALLSQRPPTKAWNRPWHSPHTPAPNALAFSYQN